MIRESDGAGAVGGADQVVTAAEDQAVDAGEVDPPEIIGSRLRARWCSTGERRSPS
jgi:hypothetical protein